MQNIFQLTLEYAPEHHLIGTQMKVTPINQNVRKLYYQLCTLEYFVLSLKFPILFSKDITSNPAMLMHIMLCQECAARRKQAFPQTMDNCQMRKVDLEKNLESEGAVKRRLNICQPSKMNQSHRWYEF